MHHLSTGEEGVAENWRSVGLEYPGSFLSLHTPSSPAPTLRILSVSPLRKTPMCSLSGRAVIMIIWIMLPENNLFSERKHSISYFQRFVAAGKIQCFGVEEWICVCVLVCACITNFNLCSLNSPLFSLSNFMLQYLKDYWIMIFAKEEN